MSEHRAVIEWTLQGPSFQQQQYTRGHTWRFDGGAVVAASASPAVVPAPWSDPAAVDPEEAYVAAIASCHMLWWLSLAARQGLEVVSYRDEATGRLEQDERGRLWVSRVTLHPVVQYEGRAATPEEEHRLHELAHDRCFIANSVRTEIVVKQPGAV